jgi:hypothetical protein
MNFDRVNLRVMRVMLGMALTFAITTPASADDTWHNVYHSLKHFFTGKSGSSPTPTVHHRAKHDVTHEKTDESSQPSPSASVTTAPDNASSRLPSATPRVVVLPAPTSAPSPAVATPENIANSDTTQKSQGEQPTPTPVSAATPAESGSASEVGPVLRSLSDQNAAASPTPTPR